MSIGAVASPVRHLKAGLRPCWFNAGLRPDWPARLALVTGVLSAMVVGLELIKPIHASNPTGRAALETTITLAAIFTAWLLVGNFQHSGRLPDLLLICALAALSLTDFVYCAAPALAGGSRLESGGGGRLACELIVSAAFAAAAFAPSKVIRHSDRHLIWGAALGCGGIVILSELLDRAVGSHWTASLQDVGIQGAVEHPVALACNVVAAAILLLSAVAFLRRGRRGDIRCVFLAAVSFLLAGARLQSLAIPALATNWVTPRDGLRLAAYALLLGGVYHEYAKMRRAEALAAISSERERIARDLHDGLAQDLACIAAQGQRLGTELRPEHPLMVAARSALATSRGAIADLSASTAPTTEAALQVIASELSHRYGVHITVRTETATGPTRLDDLEPSRREHVVRIAREAIANAALHGGARRVDVVLVGSGSRLLMRITDDGCGITGAHGSGMGLQTMHARAAALGGHLTAHSPVCGGTELELIVR
jgi:signal transduction histidine kinase